MHLLILIGILGILACNNTPAQYNSIEKLPEDFQKFYKRFHADSAFQMNHILFPLPGKPNNTRKGEFYPTFRWKKSDWVLHRDMGKLLDSYVTHYSVDSDFIIEEIYHKTGTWKIERDFSKIGNEWFLVYYAGTTKVKSIFKQ